MHRHGRLQPRKRLKGGADLEEKEAWAERARWVLDARRRKRRETLFISCKRLLSDEIKNGSRPELLPTVRHFPLDSADHLEKQHLILIRGMLSKLVSFFTSGVSLSFTFCLFIGPSIDRQSTLVYLLLEKLL